MNYSPVPDDRARNSAFVKDARQTLDFQQTESKHCSKTKYRISRKPYVSPAAISQSLKSEWRGIDQAPEPSK
jgi:hypothetical protein